MHDLGPVLQHLCTLAASPMQACSIDLTAGADDDPGMEAESESDDISDREVARILRSRPSGGRKKVIRGITKKSRMAAAERGYDSL